MHELRLSTGVGVQAGRRGTNGLGGAWEGYEPPYLCPYLCSASRGRGCLGVGFAHGRQTPTELVLTVPSNRLDRVLTAVLASWRSPLAVASTSS